MLREHIWSDEPITSPGEDVLQRSRFAEVIASRITAVDRGHDSTVFGVVGPWGAGKTSILNMVRGQLGDSWRVSDFSPWSAQDPQGLALEFLAAVTAAVGSKRGQSRKVRAAVKKYAKLGTPFLALVPVVGGFANGVADRGLDLLDQGASWRREFDALAKVTKDLDYSILLVADDIDRLDSVELMTFLKAVRLHGRLPNVHYLIAYDQGTIEQLLASQGVEGRHASFMEKIVQYPFELPRLSRAVGKFASAMRQFLHADVEGAIRLGRIRVLVSYFKQIEGEASVAGLAAPFLMAHPERGIDLARGFVRVERWVGTNGESPELAFDESGYRLITTAESRIRAADHLPVVPDLPDIDPEDIGDINQQLFAAAWAIRVAMGDRSPRE